MHRPFVFLATTDPEFEATAIDAILNTAHGLRSVRDICAASQMLSSDGAREIALAIVDLDFDGHGLSLLHILGGCEPGFPILAICDPADARAHEEALHSIAVGHLVKPVPAAILQRTIRTLCEEHAASETWLGTRRLREQSPPRVHPAEECAWADYEFAGAPAGSAVRGS